MKVIESKHFELTKETMVFKGRRLYRIRCTRDIEHAKAGDLGGWVEKLENLHDTAWVDGNAKVLNDAYVCHNALLKDNAIAQNDVLICGSAKVSGHAQISENAIIAGHSQVKENAKIYGHALVADLAVVYGYACVRRQAMVHDRARVGSRVVICGNAVVGGDSRIFENAVITDNAVIDGNAVVCGNSKISNDVHLTTNHIVTGRIHMSDKRQIIPSISTNFRGTVLELKERVWLAEGKFVHIKKLEDTKGQKYNGFLFFDKEKNNFSFMFPLEYKEYLLYRRCDDIQDTTRKDYLRLHNQETGHVKYMPSLEYKNFLSQQDKTDVKTACMPFTDDKTDNNSRKTNFKL